MLFGRKEKGPSKGMCDIVKPYFTSSVPRFLRRNNLGLGGASRKCREIVHFIIKKNAVSHHFGPLLLPYM